MAPASSGGSSYRSLSTGSGGSILFLIPSRPAMSIAANARYGLQDGSGTRDSTRLAFGFCPAAGSHRGEGVAGGVGEARRLGGRPKRPADVVAAHVRQARVADLVVEQRRAV